MKEGLEPWVPIEEERLSLERKPGKEGGGWE